MNVLVATFPYFASQPLSIQNLIYLKAFEKQKQPIDVVDYPEYDLVRTAGIVKKTEGCNLYAKSYSRLPLWMLEKDIHENSIDLVIFDSTNYQIIDGLKSFIKTLDSIKVTRPQCLTLLSGRDPSFLGLKLIQAVPSIDMIIYGEPELTLNEIINSLSDGNSSFYHWRSSVAGIDGLIYREDGNAIIRTGARSELSELDCLPFPDYDHLPIDSRTTVSIFTSRGCPFSCHFCYKMFKRVRSHSPTYVAEMLKFMNSKYGISKFTFDDEITGCNLKWLSSFQCELNKRGLKIKFNCYSRPDLLSNERISILKECGCSQIRIGVESGSQEILNAMNKKTSRNMIVKAFELAHFSGLETLAFILLGYPPESHRTVQETFELLSIIKPYHVSAKIVQILPGTVLFEQLKKKGYVDESIFFSESGKLVPPGNLTKDQLHSYANDINDKFNNF